MIDICQNFVMIAESIRGKDWNDGSTRHLMDAMEAADCCRQKSRFDLATELLDMIESVPLGNKPPFVSLVHELRIKLAKKDTSGNPQQIPSEPPRTPLPPDLPPLVIRGWNFAVAMLRWRQAGFKTRTKEEIAARLAICQECPRLVKGVCTSCGCACVESEQVMNKLALRGQSCPLGKWGDESLVS